MGRCEVQKMTMDFKKALQTAGIDRTSMMAYVDDDQFVQSLQNWSKLHPELAKLNADGHGVEVCRAYLVLELTRPQGPRVFYVDRIYKRMSNLRREMEREVLAPFLDNTLAEAA